MQENPCLSFQKFSHVFNASFGCRNFVLDLEIHHESAHARDSSNPDLALLSLNRRLAV